MILGSARLRYAFLILSFTALASASSSVAQTSSAAAVTEPKEAGIFYLLDPAGSLVSLEFDQVQKQWSALQVRGDRSQVRFASGTTFRFVVRLAPGTKEDQISFLKDAIDKGYRVVPLVLSGRKMVIKPDSGAAIVHYETAAYGSSSTLVTAKGALDPGEYCIGVGAAKEAYCFGVDTGTDAAAAPQATPVAIGSAMTNADVIKMAGASLSADVIVSAINRASSRNFDLSVDGLIALKTAHVQDAVITAMNRATDAATSTTAPPSPKALAAVSDAQIETPAEAGIFYLVGPGGHLRKLEPIRPAITRQENDLFEGNRVYYSVYGAHSPVRVPDGNVALVIKLTPKDNKAHLMGDYKEHDLSDMYYRRFESVTGARQTVVSAKIRRRGNKHDPDPGEFDFSVTKLGADFYKVVPNDPLIPGEYCVDPSLFTTIDPIHCFGVDGPR